MRQVLLFFITILVISFTSNQAIGQCPGTDLILITQAGEGSGNNKYLEITNAGTNSVDVTGYQIGVSANGEGSDPNDLTLADLTDFMGGNTVLAPGETIILYNSGAGMDLVNAVVAGGTYSGSSGVVSNNGNDAYLLYDGPATTTGTLIDSLGEADSSSNDESKESDLQRRNCTPDTDPNDAIDVVNVWTDVPYSSGDPGDLGGATMLPVELTYFTAKTIENKTVALEWRTETEVNNHYMAVERSRDGKQFAELAKVKGNGTTLEAQVYTFVDDAPKAGVNYYRLKQVDFDGTYEYHNVVAVNITDDKNFSVYPTLVDNTVNINIEGQANLTIRNIAGAIVKTIQVTDFQAIDVSDLVKGTYFMIIESDNLVEAVGFVKQ